MKVPITDSSFIFVHLLTLLICETFLHRSVRRMARIKIPKRDFIFDEIRFFSELIANNIFLERKCLLDYEENGDGTFSLLVAHCGLSNDIFWILCIFYHHLLVVLSKTNNKLWRLHLGHYGAGKQLLPFLLQLIFLILPEYFLSIFVYKLTILFAPGLMTIYRTFTLLIEKFPRFSFINAIITLSGVGSIRAFIMTIRYLIEAQYVIVKEGNTEKILLNDDVNDLGDKISFNRIVVLLSGSSRAALGSNISDDASSNTENGSSSAQHEVKPVQNHVTALSPVLSAEGVPSPGWASDGALFKYSREAVRADPWRVKEWDWYQVSNSHVALQFTFGHASYAGQVGVMLFDFQKQKTIYVCDCILPVPVLWMKLDASAGEDSVLEYKKKGMWMQITTKEKGKVRRIACKTEEFECDVTLSRLNDNSIALVVPFKESENQFYFNEKINCMSASGKATVNGVDFIFRNASQTEKRKDSSISHIVEPSSKLDSSSSEAKESLLLDNSSEKEEQANEQDDNMKAKSEVGKDVCVDRADCDEAWGLLDWGRGVWPYHNEWYWSNATGRVNGKVFGFNLGCGFGETSKATENCLFFEGSLHKLGNVKIICDHQDYMKEWKLEDEEGRVALALSPTFDRKTETKMLWVDNCTHQMFGKFHGVVSLDDGTKLEIDNIFGFSEYAVNNW